MTYQKKRKFTRKPKITSRLTEPQKYWLLHGHGLWDGDPYPFQGETAEKAAWDEHKLEILKAKKPFTGARPWAWWKYTMGMAMPQRLYEPELICYHLGLFDDRDMKVFNEWQAETDKSPAHAAARGAMRAAILKRIERGEFKLHRVEDKDRRM